MNRGASVSEGALHVLRNLSASWPACPISHDRAESRDRRHPRRYGSKPVCYVLSRWITQAHRHALRRRDQRNGRPATAIPADATLALPMDDARVFSAPDSAGHASRTQQAARCARYADRTMPCPPPCPRCVFRDTPRFLLTLGAVASAASAFGLLVGLERHSPTRCALALLAGVVAWVGFAPSAHDVGSPLAWRGAVAGGAAAGLLLWVVPQWLG